MRSNIINMLFVYSLCFFSFSFVVFSQEKPCATASKFGADDEIGNLNYVTAEKTLAASKLVTKGKTYKLGIETNKNIPAFPPHFFDYGFAAGTNCRSNARSDKNNL